MSIKKVLLPSLIFLVSCCSIWASSFFVDCSVAQGFDFVRVTDSSNIQSDKVFSFRVGTRFSGNSALFAQIGLSLAESRINLGLFKTNGNCSFVQTAAGFSLKNKSYYFSMGAGLDFLFASAMAGKIYGMVNVFSSVESPIMENESITVSSKADVSISFARGLFRAACSVGVCLRPGWVR